ncbi:ATP-binding protein [Desulfopila sp. IMCC35008]|uniref:ATP-binding protein n=1 Tax=Desulfopila sp. IMCC35008 TaxID=2653858 RepID=UPI0013D6E67C|nr:ATP-binding protein [Desulfopila sp. IMCC35008]
MKFRFFHKLFLGFAIIGCFVLIVAIIGLSIIRGNSKEMKTLIDQQIKPLAEVAILQGHANNIRKQEAELVRVTDYFAITANIDILSENKDKFEQKLFEQFKLKNSNDDSVKKLLLAWELYRADLDQTIVLMNNGDTAEARNHTIYSSTPRFTVFEESLQGMATSIQRQATNIYAESVEAQTYRQKLFLVFSGVAIALGILLAYLYTRSLTLRVKLLNEEARRLSTGALHVPITQQGSDELSELAGSLELMRGNLEKRELELQNAKLSLEEKVAERTQSLKRSNEFLKKEINERKQIERELRESDERLRKTQRIAGLGSWIYDAENVQVQFPDNLREIFGISESYVSADLDKILERFVPLEEQEKIRQIIKTEPPEGQITPFESTIILPSGDKRTIWIEGECIYNGNGKLLKVIGTVLDITERKAFEEQLLRSKRVDSIGHLASGIAHDFNNLLTAISGNAHLAETSKDPVDQKKYLHELVQVTDRAKDLAGKLLTFAKGGVPKNETVSIKSLIDETTKIAFAGSSIFPEIILDNDHMAVDIDRSQIGQVLQNLFINARDAMPEGGDLLVTAKKTVVDNDNLMSLNPGEYVEVTVKDSGVGIQEKDLTHIFDLYFSNKSRGPDRGTGLGLAICHSIIKKHHGDIRVESKYGQGTTFTFYLPASKNRFEKIRKQDVELIAGKGKVLLMDDEKIVRDVGINLLETLGYQVELAVNGEETITLYSEAIKDESKFDAVILDLTIRGGMGGFETLKKLKEIDPGVKAIVSSGYSDSNQNKDYLEHGFSAAVPKPYNLSELSSTLHEVITS